MLIYFLNLHHEAFSYAVKYLWNRPLNVRRVTATCLRSASLPCICSSTRVHIPHIPFSWNSPAFSSQQQGLGWTYLPAREGAEICAEAPGELIQWTDTLCVHTHSFHISPWWAFWSEKAEKVDPWTWEHHSPLLHSKLMSSQTTLRDNTAQWRRLWGPHWGLNVRLVTYPGMLDKSSAFQQ